MSYFVVLLLLFSLTNRVAIVFAVTEPLPSSICATWNQSNCVGEDRAILKSEVRVSYILTYDDGNARQREKGPTLNKDGEAIAIYNLSYYTPQTYENETLESVVYYFEQLEHGGGGCNCVNIYINCVEEDNRLASIIFYNSCFDSTSMALVILANKLYCKQCTSYKIGKSIVKESWRAS